MRSRYARRTGLWSLVKTVTLTSRGSPRRRPGRPPGLPAGTSADCSSPPPLRFDHPVRQEQGEDDTGDEIDQVLRCHQSLDKLVEVIERGKVREDLAEGGAGEHLPGPAEEPEQKQGPETQNHGDDLVLRQARPQQARAQEQTAHEEDAQVRGEDRRPAELGEGGQGDRGDRAQRQHAGEAKYGRSSLRTMAPTGLMAGPPRLPHAGSGAGTRPPASWPRA